MILSVLLRRVDPKRRMFRYYALSVEITLFGEVVLIRRWGRIGSSGRCRSERFTGVAEASKALEAWCERKRRRGYVAL